ncbi:MAG: hypothetical protein IKO48_06030 [Elusimicrobia bacterium]|nr:hypothetical protein [Elusimicrobiota bacterium]
MEENLQEQSSSCPAKSKKCCVKGIVIVVVCSLICFFLGYYFGNKTNSNINRVVGSGINRPFNPNRIPNRIQNVPRIPNPQRIQRPPIQRNIPPRVFSQNIQRPNNIPQNTQTQAKPTNNTAEQKK